MGRATIRSHLDYQNPSLPGSFSSILVHHRLPITAERLLLKWKSRHVMPLGEKPVLKMTCKIPRDLFPSTSPISSPIISYSFILLQTRWPPSYSLNILSICSLMSNVLMLLLSRILFPYIPPRPISLTPLCLCLEATFSLRPTLKMQIKIPIHPPPCTISKNSISMFLIAYLVISHCIIISGIFLLFPKLATLLSGISSIMKSQN